MNCCRSAPPRAFRVVVFALLLGAVASVSAAVPDAAAWEFTPGKVEFADYAGRPAMRLLPDAGAVVLKSPSFANGTIEFDYQPLDPRFATIHFRWQNADENEAFYFRTARAGDAKAGDAIQYTPTIRGTAIWDLLGHYQGPATFQKDAWNHVKLVFSGAQLRAYVNSEEKPTLVVPRLEGDVTTGRIAFEGQAAIANLVVTPDAVADLRPEPGSDPTEGDARYLRYWQVSATVPIPAGIDFAYDSLPKPDAAWTPLSAERRGLVNLTRKFGKSESRRLVWLRTRLTSPSAQGRRLSLGFSDEVWVLINGKLLYVDKNWYFHPIRKEPDGRCALENTTFNLPLNAGDNELLIGVANDFYGWGLIARLDDLAGITLAPGG